MSETVRRVRFPTATTARAVAALFACNRRFIKGRSGYGGGKTHAGVFWCIKQAALNPGLSGLAVEPTSGMVDDILVPKIEEVCEASGLPFRLSKPSGRLNWHLPDFGFTWLLRSADKPHRLVGPTLAAGLIDEAGLQANKVFRIVVSRVRDRRAPHPAILALGTPDQFNFFYSVWHKHRVHPDYAEFHWTTMDNAANLDPAYIPTMLENFDELQVRAYLYGEHVNLASGLVFSNFTDANIMKRPIEPDPGDSVSLRAPERLIWTMDFNVNPMTAVLWLRRGDDMVAVDELVLRHSHTQETAAEMQRRFPFSAWPRQLVVCDATGTSRSSVSGYSNVDVLKEAGFEVDFLRVRHEMDAINAARAMICNARGRRRLFVHERCRKLVTSMQTWSFEPDSMKTMERQYADDPELYFVPHLADNVKYLCHVLFPVSKPQWKVDDEEAE